MRCLKSSKVKETESTKSTSTTSSSLLASSTELTKKSPNEKKSTNQLCEKFDWDFRKPDPKQGKNFERSKIKPPKNLQTHQKNLLGIPDSVKAAKKSGMNHRTSILNFGCRLEEFFIQRKFQSMSFQRLKRLHKTILNMDQKQLESFSLDLRPIKVRVT